MENWGHLKSTLGKSVDDKTTVGEGLLYLYRKWDKE
jgi:hypothetical protein